MSGHYLKKNYPQKLFPRNASLALGLKRRLDTGTGARRKVDDVITGTGKMAVMGGREEDIARISSRDTPVEVARSGMPKL